MNFVMPKPYYIIKVASGAFILKKMEHHTSKANTALINEIFG